MKVLYVTDLHGNIAKYEQVLQVAKEKQIKYIINGGDMLPKGYDQFHRQYEFLSEYLNSYFDRIGALGMEYYCMLGNDDLAAYDNIFDSICKRFSYVHNIENNKVDLGDHEVIGMNYVLDYPFGLKDRVVIEDGFIFETQKSGAFYTKTGQIVAVPNWEEFARANLNIMQDILEALPIPEDSNKAVYVMHMPPANVGLGEIGHSDISVGSNEIYNFIKKMQPLLTLHGHVHESPESGSKLWSNKIGETVCIQPGQTGINEEDLVYVLIDLEQKSYERETCKIVSIVK